MKKRKTNKLKKLVNKLVAYIWLGGLVIVLMLCSVAIGKYHYAEEKIVEVVEVENELKEKPEETIKRILDEEGVDFLKVFRIIECESRWNVYFKEKMKDGSYDRGLYAFNSFHYANVSDECAFNVECATREFIKSYKNNKLNDWLCARHLEIK
jgi:hypothetical protein